MRRRIERWVLWRFSEEERAEITADLEELAAARTGAARRLYYAVELAKYSVRDVWDSMQHGDLRKERGGGAMRFDVMWGDLRYAWRGLVRSPGFSLVAVAIMAVGMGAATAIVSVVDGVLLRPLPIEEPDRLLSVWLVNPEGQRARMTPGNVVDVSELDGVFDGVAAFGAQSTSISVDGDPVFLQGSRVTPGYFSTLGVTPVLGRGFLPDEGVSGGESVVVLSHHVWVDMFGSDPDIVRRTVDLDGARFQVVGVVPPGVYPTHATVSAVLPFTEGSQDFFVPLRYSDAGWDNRRSHVVGTIARLSDGTTVESARERVAALSDRLQSEGHPNSAERLLLTSFTDEVVGDVRFGLLTLLGTVGLVLLIALVNVASLFVLRADQRRAVFTIRAALGASRSRLVRQLLMESVLVVAVSAAAALFVADGVLRVMKAMVPYQIPRLADVSVSPVALAATVLVGLCVASLVPLLPALRLHARSLHDGVRRSAGSASRRRRRLHTGVVGVQAALCLLVLVTAGLLGRSYAALRAVDPGFEAAGLWTVTVNVDPSRADEVVEGVRTVPGVAHAAIAYDHPLERNWGDSFLIDGIVRSEDDPPTVASLRPFGVGYFETVGIETVEGRVPDALDLAGDVPYAVINEALASTYLAGRSVVGTRITVPSAARIAGGDGVFEIAAVVENVRFLGPAEAPTPGLYVPLPHFPAYASTLLVRTERADVDVAAGVRGAVAAVDPTIGVRDARPMQGLLDDLTARPRFNMMLLTTFGGVGLLLCGLGVYGLVSRVVVSRRRDIGVRMALGADAPRLAGSVLRGALVPMAVGGALGGVLAVAASRSIRSLLFGISPLDPASFAGSAAFLLLVGVLAAAIPAARAVSIDPSSTLREE